jgi:hypothetical protein
LVSCFSIELANSFLTSFGGILKNKNARRNIFFNAKGNSPRAA